MAVTQQEGQDFQEIFFSLDSNGPDVSRVERLILCGDAARVGAVTPALCEKERGGRTARSIFDILVVKWR